MTFEQYANQRGWNIIREGDTTHLVCCYGPYLTEINIPNDHPDRIAWEITLQVAEQKRAEHLNSVEPIVIQWQPDRQWRPDETTSTGRTTHGR